LKKKLKEDEKSVKVVFASSEKFLKIKQKSF